MKKSRIIISCLLIFAFLLSLSSCLMLDDGKSGDYMTEEDVRNLISSQLGENVTVEGGDNYNINIEGSATVASAAAKGLLSAVSVECNFTVRSGIYPSKTTKATSSGSGVIYKLDKENGNAYIITNYHVVYHNMSTTSGGISDDITLYLYGSEPQTISGYGIKASYIGGSMNYDIAVLKVENSAVLARSNAREAEFADSNNVSVLDMAIAIGNAAAAGISATVGYVNVDSEYLEMEGADGYTPISLRVMRIDTAVNGGNSGGGLFNERGELIGIVNAKLVDSDIDNIGYAIPSNVVKYISDNIIYYCDGTDKTSVYRCILGITVNVTEAHSELDTETGKVVRRETVTVGSVLDDSIVKGLLEAGDIIKSITIDGKTYEVDRTFKVIDSMLNARVGSTVTFNIIRGSEMSVDISITEDTLTQY
ncbi:MAG: trypsin-like peptidase domain-containing protein [Clostridia bacterium]|nr:trypsin-like peptidase domain-containing protein [Clostridia bacterium]